MDTGFPSNSAHPCGGHESAGGGLESRVSGLNLSVILAHHDGRDRSGELRIAFEGSGEKRVSFGGAEWRVALVGRREPGRHDLEVELEAVVVSGSARSVAAGLCWEDCRWAEENYVLIPGAVYAGNRFDALRRAYPPEARDIGQRCGSGLLDIGDIPRLSRGGGPSHIDQLSADAAVPGLGVFFPGRRLAWLLLCDQLSPSGHPYGLEVRESRESRDRARASILCMAPGFLHPLPDQPGGDPEIANLASACNHPENGRPADLSRGEAIRISATIACFPAESVHELFSGLFQRRKARSADASPASDVLPFSEAFQIIARKQTRENWNERHGIFQSGLPWLPGQRSQFWQNGWLGGGIPLVAMLGQPDEGTRARVLRNLEFLFTKGVSASGLFKAIMSEDGEWSGDGFADWDGGPAPQALVRRNGDCLVFAIRSVLALRNQGEGVPAPWFEAIRRCAQAWCRIWDREHEFGFLVDWETGGLVIRGSTSGALLPAGLVLAYELFGDPEFLRVASESADLYRTGDLARGVTTGGPGDAVQAPDCESAFSLVESFIALHEVTREAGWLEAACQAARLAGSWVISYPHRFPSGSALGRLGIDARGTMLANAQNKCAVPGICTLSGEGLLRTFRASGDAGLLELLRDIAHAIPQYVSRADRPIPAAIRWGHPGKENLPEGWICERVNVTPSWNEPLGEQAAYSCWCEIAMMLTWSDLPGVYGQPDTGILCALDHVKAEWDGRERHTVRLTNPTAFPARVKVLLETSSEAASIRLPANNGLDLPVVDLAPFRSERFSAA